MKKKIKKRLEREIIHGQLSPSIAIGVLEINKAWKKVEERINGQRRTFDKGVANLETTKGIQFCF